MIKRILFLLVLMLLSSTVACGAQFSADNLFKHPEFWPEYTTITKGANFKSGQTLTSGQSLKVIRIKRDLVVLDDEQLSSPLAVPFAYTSIVKDADNYYNSLPEHVRSINFNNLSQYRDFFPYTVTSKVTLPFTNKTIKAGTKLNLLEIKEKGEIICILNGKVILPHFSGQLVKPQKYFPDS